MRCDSRLAELSSIGFFGSIVGMKKFAKNGMIFGMESGSGLSFFRRCRRGAGELLLCNCDGYVGRR